MKIFVIDAAGMVGHVVAMYFESSHHNVVTYDEVDPKLGLKWIHGGLTDYRKIEDEIIDNGYDAVINCAAIINQDAEDNKVRATEINCVLPRFLEQITSNLQTVIVHRSTDCIFSGEKGNYTLEDWPESNTYYARSKALGELNNGKDISLRVSLIGPEREIDGAGLFNWYYNQQGEVGGYANAIWTGITTIEFARQIEWLLKNDKHGLYQTVPDIPISKYNLVKIFEKYYPGGRSIKRVENQRLDRSLVQIKPEGLNVPSYDEMIADMRHWTDEHKEIYRYC